MNYMIARDGHEYGPYSLGDLQRYISSGEILLTDLTRSEGMTEFLPVSEVIGSIPVPAQPTHVAPEPTLPRFSNPPNLPWGLMILFELLTCFLFTAVWGIVMAVWMMKVDPKSKALFYYLAYAVCNLLFLYAIFFGNPDDGLTLALRNLIRLGNAGFGLAARFSLKNSLEVHFNSAEPIGLKLSGPMTFFFGEIYLQYHLNDINRRKRLAGLGF